MPVYDEPLYYEISFSFVDVPRQVDLFEVFIHDYSSIPVRRVLDIGCGPSQQLREFAGRGYEAVGLDRSPQMLAYLKEKSREAGVRVETVEADMADFALDGPVDLALILMGTIGLMGSKENLLSHLDSVARSLNRGGLYIIENLNINWHSPDYGSQMWTMERDGVLIEITYSVELDDSFNQMLRETLRLDVDDHGRKQIFEETIETRAFFPQEFITLVGINDMFEFLGYFERSSTKRLTEALPDNIALLRRSQAHIYARVFTCAPSPTT
jgi:SAM-dependent methyltransferase